METTVVMLNRWIISLSYGFYQAIFHCCPKLLWGIPEQGTSATHRGTSIVFYWFGCSQSRWWKCDACKHLGLNTWTLAYVRSSCDLRLGIDHDTLPHWVVVFKMYHSQTNQYTNVIKLHVAAVTVPNGFERRGLNETAWNRVLSTWIDQHYHAPYTGLANKIEHGPYVFISTTPNSVPMIMHLYSCTCPWMHDDHDGKYYRKTL